MLGSVILGVLTTLLVLFMDRALMGKEIFSDPSWLVKPLEGEDGDVALREACVIGAVVFLARVATKFWGTFPALLALFAMIAAMLYIVYWWAVGRGRNWRAFLCFLVLEWILAWAASKAATVVTAGIKSGFLRAVVNALPTIASILAIWSAIVGWLRRSDRKLLAFAAKVLAIILVVCTIMGCFSGVSLKNGAVIGGVTAANASGKDSLWASFKRLFTGNESGNGAVVNPTLTPNATPEATASPKSDVWYGFYNPSLLKDDDPNNDYNFGYNCYEDGKPASYYDQELRKRMKVDPALGAADMAWVDCLVGSRYMGVFYDECGAWDAAINAARDQYIAEGKEKYYGHLDAFFSFLDHATKVEVMVAKNGIEDQMYMNPFTETGIPDIFVMKTDHEGHFLVYTFTIKGKEVQVPFRIECGFQPCNVEKAMGIEPTTPAGGFGDNPPSPPSPPDPPGPPDPPDPPPSYPPKDPTHGTDVGGNDTDGPGRDTNTGPGGQQSSAEQPTNSSSGSYDDYQDTMEDLGSVNDDQRTGGDPSTPTVPTSPGTTVDDNSGSGTGHGGVDTPTPVSEPVHIEVGGGTETPTEPAGEWGGPPD